MDRLNRLTSNWDGLDGVAGGSVELHEPVDCLAKAPEHLEHLFHTIETEIIPRLMMSHRSPADCPVLPVRPDTVPDAETVQAFTRLVVEEEGEVAIAYVEALRARGTPLETLYLNLITPAARRLGELWEADLCDFTEVTVGLWRLQQVLRGLGPAFREENGEPSNGRRILLVPAPGEQHVLGLIILGDYFRRAGWDVSSEPSVSRDELRRVIRSEWFDVVGLSLGCEVRVETLAAEIAAIRETSRNSAVAVMVGGPLLMRYPDLLARVGADGTASDGRGAVEMANGLVERGAGRI
jgi:methanogenic corrinoid protein MtbC1